MKKHQLLFSVVFLLSFHSAFCCTMFTMTKDGETLVGNNEDYFDPYAKYWFQPAEPGRLGGVYFGWTNEFPQGGMNENGLVYDGFALDAYDIPGSGKTYINPRQFINDIMATCSTIDDVIKLVNAYDLSFLSRSQLMFVDSTGASVIVEGNALHYKKDNYQISTNFRLSTVTNNQYPCERYNTCNSLLSESDVTIESFKNILNKTHQEGEISTQYSNIYDPVNKVIYLYQFHNYDTAIIIDLKKDLGTQRKLLFMHSSFSPTAEYSVFKQNYDAGMQEKLDAVLKNPEQYSVGEINRFAGEFFRLNKIDQALALVKVNVKTNPDSYMAHAGLAQVYYTAGNKKEAIAHYKKSIKLNPQLSEEDKEMLNECRQTLAELEK